MTTENRPLSDTWDSGAAYEPYVGRWSRLVAREFLAWLMVPPGRRWLDVGCGTGALTQTILSAAEPASVIGVDRSPGYVRFAREQVGDRRASFELGDAQAIAHPPASFDVAVSGLVLNFVPNPALAVSEMTRVTRPGGTVAAYVWDYAGKMELMRYFWDAAVALDPAARELDEGRRFPLCQPDALRELFHMAGLAAVDIRSIDVPTSFRDFDDYWTPFLGGQGPAPSYVRALPEAGRSALRERLHATLPVGSDGSIHLVARGWAVRGMAGQAPN
jgi:SAM-dependent methyltransferase